jgi:Kef-type K+ transport system membrane component KefB
MIQWLSELAAHPFYEFAIILFFAALLGTVGQLLRQPLIVMFIALGILVGPSVLDVVKSKDNIHLLAEIGISVLLFIVGLKLDVRIIKTMGKIALLTGLGQVLFTSVIGYLIGLALGFSSLHSFYIAVALTFSSTIIIVKLLSDKKEIDSLHGQIAIGFLIVQDIVVILVMIVLSAMGSDTDSSLTTDIFKTILSGSGLLLLTWAAMRWIIPGLSTFLAKSQELLTLFAVAWAVSLASLGEIMGFSGEVGAFLAGVSLASSRFKDVISSRLVSLRDFLLLFFFVNLGANLDLSTIGSQLAPAIIFSVFVLVGNPLIVLVIMGAMGYRKRTSFLAGLTVAQISEFSLIFAGLGLAVGHISEEIVGLITLVGLITIGLSTYLILYSHQIYNKIAPLLRVFQKANPFRENAHPEHIAKPYDIIIIGIGRFGNRLAEMLDTHPELSYLGVDFDPVVVNNWLAQGKEIVYGDIEDPELLDQIPFESSRVIISTVPDLEHSKQLIKALHRAGYQGKIFVTVSNRRDMQVLEKYPVEKVLMPQQMAATNFYNYFLKNEQLSN